MSNYLQSRKPWIENSAFPVFVFRLIGVAIYSNTLHSPFVFDDGPSITRNPTIKSLENFFGNSTGYDKYPTRFIGYLPFALNYAFGAFDPFGYHIFNLTIHMINSLLVYFFVLITFHTPFMKKSLPEATAREISLISGMLFLYLSSFWSMNFLFSMVPSCVVHAFCFLFSCRCLLFPFR